MNADNSIETPSAQASAPTYGAQVFAQLTPVFARSCCTHYRGDFVEHDRRSFELTAVPGMQYLWAVRSNGTHLVTLGVTRNTELVRSILRESDASRAELHHVSVTHSGCRVLPVEPARALVLAGTAPTVTMTGVRAPFVASPSLYTFARGKTQIATASVCARYSRERNRTLAHVAASIPEYLEPLLRMHVAIQIDEACTAEAGSLFWSYGQRQVNEMEFEQWLQRLTRCSVLAT